MKKARNQIQIGREPLSHYVIRSEIDLSWLFAFFAICSTGLLIYSIFTFDDNIDNSLFIEQMGRLHIPIWSYSFSLKMKKKSK